MAPLRLNGQLHQVYFRKNLFAEETVLLVYNKGWFGATEALHGCWNVRLNGCKKTQTEEKQTTRNKP